LLNQVAVDELVFENKKTTLIPNLSEEWITGKIRLSWIDDENVLVEIEELSCELNETCDYCNKEFKRKIEIHWYSSRFTLNKDEINYANDEVLFFIDEKTATINIEELIYQAIELETPFVLYCPECAKTHENLIEDEEIEEADLQEWQWWNITFHK
jgi:uncharacterized metal-binding protein YceD (DUF177 family)